MAQNFHVTLALKKKTKTYTKANQIQFNTRLTSDFCASSDTSSYSPACLEAELQDLSTVFPGGSVAVGSSWHDWLADGRHKVALVCAPAQKEFFSNMYTSFGNV